MPGPQAEPAQQGEHVLVLTQNDVASPTYGGALRVAAPISYMRSRGVTVSVIRFRTAQDRPSPEASGVRDIVVPPVYSVAPVAALWQSRSRAADRIVREVHAAHPVTVVQSDPPWPSLAGERLACKLGVPHVVLSQNCETALATQFSMQGPARRIPLVGVSIAKFNLAVLRRAEKQAIEHATLAFTPSVADRAEMASFGIDTSGVDILPNGTAVRYLPESARVDVRKRLGVANEAPLVIFLGRLDYPPNLEAVHAIGEHIAPMCDGAQFLLVGSNPPLMDLPDNVLMVGGVDSVDEYLRAADLAIVPLRQGSGTRIKILDSWAAGLPVLSTTIGASGLNYTHMENIVIEDTIGSFPARIKELFDDAALMRRLGQSARSAVRPYLWENISAVYLRTISELTTYIQEDAAAEMAEGLA